MTEDELRVKKEETLDPILEQLIGFYIVTIRKIRSVPERKQVQAKLRGPIREYINPRIVSFIVDEELTYSSRIAKRHASLYKMEDKSVRAIRVLVDAYYANRNKDNRFLRSIFAIIYFLF